MLSVVVVVPGSGCCRRRHGFGGRNRLGWSEEPNNREKRKRIKDTSNPSDERVNVVNFKLRGNWGRDMFGFFQVLISGNLIP